MKITKNVLLLTALLLLGLLTTNCTPTTTDPDALETRVAATIYAGQTAQARGDDDASPVARSTLPPADVSTPLSTIGRTSTPTRRATSTRTPTPAPAPTDTPMSSPCLPDAIFAEDVTVPDGANFSPGEKFTKTWRIRSSGCAPWPAGSHWAFVSGEQMSAPESVPVSDTPLSGTADISVEMIAPDAPGSYKGFWQMQDPDGARFGSQAYVLIVVPGPTPLPAACPANPALVEVENELSIQLTVEINGPQNATFVLPANAVQRYCVTPGEYSFVARAAGYNPLTGTKTFDSGACQCWWFYSGIKVYPDCRCDGDPTHYVPLP